MEAWPKVLIVDDEPQQTKLATYMIQSVYPGAEIRTAADGVQGLKDASLFRPHLVLTDIRMGETSLQCQA